MTMVSEAPDLAVGRRALAASPYRAVGGMVVMLGVLVVLVALSIVLGARDVTLATIWQSLTSFDPDSTSQTVVREMRLPRTLIGIAAGGALGLGGAVLQGLTRNPLADPGIMGINAGAAAFIVSGIVLFGVQGLDRTIWFGFAGAAVATVAVYGIASLGREGATPVKLALAGAAITAGLYSLTTALILTDRAAFDELRMWQVGSLAGRYMPVFWQTIPFLAVGAVIALGAGRALNGLALGDDVARALGQRIRLTRTVMFVTVAVLCGAATAACGPIVFLGLVVPHVARAIVGPDYRLILPYSLLLAPIVLLAADIVGRLTAPSGELQVGVVLGVLGAPVFVAIVRYRRIAEL